MKIKRSYSLSEALCELEKQKKVEEKLCEDKETGEDLAEYQKWVDYDMKKYGEISEETQKKVKDAGLEIVKDQYGDYEVIAKEDDGIDESCATNESCSEKQPGEKLNEADGSEGFSFKGVRGADANIQQAELLNNVLEDEIRRFLSVFSDSLRRKSALEYEFKEEVLTDELSSSVYEELKKTEDRIEAKIKRFALEKLITDAEYENRYFVIRTPYTSFSVSVPSGFNFRQKRDTLEIVIGVGSISDLYLTDIGK